MWSPYMAQADLEPFISCLRQVPVIPAQTSFFNSKGFFCCCFWFCILVFEMELQVAEGDL